ncbi:DUF4129 domain-containing protein [Microbulbifer sp. 2201CG32-9]|uniref:DUF4129 domain-containing protein n=1 Tax=Microbulbifer sp. 2201CG32-9 TaxID=3232309 RepID=UPI00345C366B
MQLERLVIRARLRSPWESVDLGIALAREHWWPLFVVWLLPASVVFAGAALLLWDSPTWGLLLVWWLKPVFDRLPLYITSRALFGESASVGGALGQFWAQNRRDWIAWLSWRRLSSTRSFDMPVTLLEQSSGSARTARLALLHRKHAGAASWLTLAGVHVEQFLSLAVVVLIFLFIPAELKAQFVPEELDVQWWYLLTSDHLLLRWCLNFVSLLAMATVAPFYIASGFCLYIGRRVELEAWDLEIQFRQLRARVLDRGARRRSSGATVAQLLLPLLLVMGLVAEVPTVRAAESPAEAREQIDTVLAGEDFHRMEEVSGWRFKTAETRSEQFPQWLIQLLEWLENLFSDSDPQQRDGDWGPLLATVIEVFLWMVGVFLLAYLLWRYRAPILASLRPRPGGESEGSPPATLFGLDVRPQSLPRDVCAEVLRLWYDGQHRAGLGLLYRATLAYLIERYGFEFGQQLTENECALLVQRRVAERQQPGDSSLNELVQQLTRAWQQLAYAHRVPDGERVRAMCGRWEEVFVREP